jgi:4-amino-4-deoxy-L-arabinose transferase-like glycosyltransferase
VAGSLVLAFVVLNAGFLAAKGVQFGGDSSRYVGGAQLVLEGGPLRGNQWAYLSYIIVVALGKVVGVGLPGVVAFQIAMAAVAGLVLTLLGARLGGRLAGLVGAGFLLANPDVVRWHGYILTDSLYIAAVVLVVFVVWRATERGRGWYALALLVLVPAATLRPTGLLLVVAATVFWAIRGIVTRDRVGLALGILGILGMTLLFVSPLVTSTIGRIPSEGLRRGRVVYQYPGYRMAMPADDQPRSGWLSDLRYVARHPGPTLALGARRVAMEMAHVRPYYRVRHNVMIVAVLLPLYALAAVGIAATWRHPLTHLLLGVVAAHLLLVAVCLADYDGRFLLHVMGPLAALAAAGVGRLTGGVPPVPEAGAIARSPRVACVHPPLVLE